jgi:dinuclear metal center YbgI/SA1388 family protein
MLAMATLAKVTTFLDSELQNDEFDDSSNNGLQVANSGNVKRVCCGVDAVLPFFEAAAERGANLVVCHHGLSWGDSLKRITGLNYRLIEFLVRHDMALYASHLPLDAHPRYGNNAQLADALGLKNRKPFGVYRGREIGFAGALPSATSLAGFKKRVATITNSRLQCMDFGNKTVRTVAIVSGGAAGEVEQAAELGVDVFISGEPQLHGYHLAEAYGVNAIFAGHYATEVFGVRALAKLLAETFAIEADFVDMQVPF